MRDRYASFAALQAGEQDDHYEIIEEDRGSDVLVMAIHGGKIEYHTSRIACAIAGDDHSLYLFEGDKPNNNYDHLHVCSIKFDEPTLHGILSSVETCVSAHGKQGEDPPQRDVDIWNARVQEVHDEVERRRCPECGYVAERRKTKTPPWRCDTRGCGNLFTDEEAVACIQKVGKALRRAWGEILGWATFYETEYVLDRYERYVEQEVGHYIDEVEVVTLCKRCHWAIENGRELCESCGENYHRLSWEKCFECGVEVGDLKECPQCGGYRWADGFKEGMCEGCSGGPSG